MVYNISKGNSDTETLRPWLLNIHARAPHCPVIIVGTHIDRLSRGNDHTTKISLTAIQMCVLVYIYQDGHPYIKTNIIKFLAKRLIEMLVSHFVDLVNKVEAR